MSESTDTPDVIDMTQGAWNEAVRRARIGAELKLALLVVGSYASSDGTGVFCGVARLAADCDVSYRTASRYLAWMRRNGFVRLVKRGNRRTGKADTYRLTLAIDVAERIELPDPDQYKAIIGQLAAANRAESKARQQRVSTDSQDDRRNETTEHTSTDTTTSVETGFYGHEGDLSTDTHGVLPPPIDHLAETTDLPWRKPDLRSSRYRSARASEDDGSDSFTDTPARACPACEAALDPDGSCFVCRTPPTRRTA